jgi:hypothetical protein
MTWKNKSNGFGGEKLKRINTKEISVRKILTKQIFGMHVGVGEEAERIIILFLGNRFFFSIPGLLK